MKNTPKTIKASGSLKRPGSIDESEQAYRDHFKVRPVGGLVVSSDRGASSAQIDDVQADDVLELVLDNDVTLFTRRDDYERDFQRDLSRNANDDELAIGPIIK